MRTGRKALLASLLLAGLAHGNAAAQSTAAPTAQERMSEALSRLQSRRTFLLERVGQASGGAAASPALGADLLSKFPSFATMGTAGAPAAAADPIILAAPTPAPTPAPAPAPTPAPAPVAAVRPYKPLVLGALDSSPTPAPAPAAPAVAATAGAGAMTMVAARPQVAAAATAPPPSPPAAPTRADAYLDFGGGPYPAADRLLQGSAAPWYNSPVVQKLYGGLPTPDQQKSFADTVLQKVEDTYAKSGLTVHLSDSAGPAAHTLSVVSGAGYNGNNKAIGVADVKGDGFTFVDKFGVVGSVNDLETAVANNIAHELMHAFGVDHEGLGSSTIDAGHADWSMLTDPNATFSADAAALLANATSRAAGTT